MAATRACARELATTAEHLINRATFGNVSLINTRPTFLPPTRKAREERKPDFPLSLFSFSPFFTSIFVTDQAEKETERERENTVYVNGLLKEDDAERYGMNGRVILGRKSTKAFSLFSFPFSLDSFFRNGKIYNGAPPSNLSRLKIFSFRQKTRKFYLISSTIKTIQFTKKS